MRRLFTFGCSYTSYCWPTWANFLQLDFKESQNWGFSGLGNQAIAERVVECHARNKFTADDVVIIQWSTHLRHDWFSMHSLPERSHGWKTAGSIFNYLNKKIYDKKWIDTFFYEPAYAMHTFNHVLLTQQFLKSIGCTWYMTSIGDLRDLGSDIRVIGGHNECSETTMLNATDTTDEKLAWKLIPDLKIYDQPIWGDNIDHWVIPFELFCKTESDLTYNFYNGAGEQYYENHPSPAQHIKWVTSKLTTELSLSQDTIDASYEIVDNCNKLHQKFLTNKDAFESALRTKSKISNNDKLIWPGHKQGF